MSHIKQLTCVTSKTLINKANDKGELVVASMDHPLRTVNYNQAMFTAKAQVVVNSMQLEAYDEPHYSGLCSKSGPQSEIMFKLADTLRLVTAYLMNPSEASYRKFITQMPLATLIAKLRLYPMPGLSVKMWSFYCSLKMFFGGPIHGIDVSGESVHLGDSLGKCFESMISKSLMTASDFVREDSGFNIFIDSTSETDTGALYAKVSKLYRQTVGALEEGLPIVVVHSKCPVKDCKSFYPDRRIPEFIRTAEIGRLYREHSQSWKDELDRVVDETLIELCEKEKYEKDESPLTPEQELSAINAFSSNSLSDKIKWIKGCRHNYCNEATLAGLFRGLQCSDLKDTVMYSGAVQIANLRERASGLEEFLGAISDPILEMFRFAVKQKRTPLWVRKDYTVFPGPMQDLEKEVEDIDFPPNVLALVMNITDEDDTVQNVRMAFNPLLLDESAYFMNAVSGPKSRKAKVHPLRSVTEKDVLESEAYKEEVVLKLSKESKHNDSLNIWARKRWVTNMAPPALRQHNLDVINMLDKIELGNALNHQFEIGNMVQMSLKNTKKHRYCLLRNGHNVSYTLLKCSAGGGAFKNCPIKVYWLSETDCPARHDSDIIKVDDSDLFFRMTKWHSVDTRMLTWYINQPLAVESRLSTVLSIDPTMIPGAADVVLNSLPTMPNTQDFSKLSGPLRNAIDSLDSVESEPTGITSKMDGLTVGSKVELWYTIDYLTTYMIGRVLHGNRAFDRGGSMKNDALGTCKFKFPEFTRLVSHPELMTNFRNAFHHVVKNKVNKLGPEARDFLAIVEEKEIYERRKATLKPGELFGCTNKDFQTLMSETLDKQAVRDSITQSWIATTGSKDSKRYRWNIWFQLRSISYDQRVNSHMTADEEEWWSKMFNTTLDEYLTATGSMESTKIDMARRQARRKSTSVYELMVMIENDTNEVPMFLKSKVAEMVRNQKDCVVSMGVICVHLLSRLGEGALIRILDKDQVEGEREISALDVVSMLACSLHEKAWSLRNKHHPVDKILAKDKGAVLRSLWSEQSASLNPDEVIFFHGRDCKRYGPNQDMQMLALNASILMTGPESIIAQLACQSLYLKSYKPPETLAAAYLGAIGSGKGVDQEGKGVLNEAFRAIDRHQAQKGLKMEGGMGQGILGIGASYSTSMAVQYTNYIIQKCSTRVRGISSAQTSDDGADAGRVKKKKMYDTLRWYSAVKQRLLCMANNITNETKSGVRLTSMELNSIRAYLKSDGDIIETTSIFKMLTAKVAVPDTMSFVEDAIKANLYAADLLKTGIPAEVVMTNCVHSLFLCYQLHKKWVFIADEQYLRIPSLLGGPIGPCFIQCCITPLAPVLVYSGGIIDSESVADLETLSKCILRIQLLDEDLHVGSDTAFGDAPALYKKSVDGLRFTRRPSKVDRKAFEELFKRGFTTGAIPNLIYPNKVVTIAEATETFVHKLTTGQASQTQPNNKYLMTWGMYRKSFSDECITVARGSPVSFLLPNDTKRISPEHLRELLCEAKEEDFLYSFQKCAERSRSKALGSLTEGKLYDAMLRQLVSKFELVGEITRALSDLHHHAQYLGVEDRVMRLNPLSTGLLRSRKDVMNLEQEIKKKVFLELTGQEGVDYLFSRFGIRTKVIPSPVHKVDLKKGMLLCEQYAAVIVDFLTLNDRYVTMRSKYSIKDDKSMVSQLLKYNMSYNKEYFYDDTELLRIKNPPLKEFVSNFWQHDIEERAEKINNSLVLAELYKVGYQPEPLYLKADNRITKLDDLYSATASAEPGDPAVFEISDTSPQSQRLLQFALALKGDVLFKNNTLYRLTLSSSGLREIGTHGAKIIPYNILTVMNDQVPTVEVINKVDGYYLHEVLIPQASPLQYYEIVNMISTEDDVYSLSVVAESNIRTPVDMGGAVGCKLATCVAPLVKMTLIEFDWEDLASSDTHTPEPIRWSGTALLESHGNGDPTPSVDSTLFPPVLSLNVALGYIGSYGMSVYYVRKLQEELLGTDEPAEEPYNADRTFAQLFASSVDVLDHRLSPYARLAVHAIKTLTHKAPKTGFKLTKLSKLVEGNRDKHIIELDQEVKRRLAVNTVHESDEEEQVTEEEKVLADELNRQRDVPEDTALSLAAEEYDPFEDVDESELPSVNLSAWDFGQ